MDVDKVVSNKVFHFFDWLFKLFILNILTLFTSLGIITILTSFTACFQSIKDYKDGSNIGVFKLYFQNFRDCFKRSVIIGVIIIVLVVIFSFALMFYYENILNMDENTSPTWITIFSIGRYISLFSLFIIIIVFIQLPIVYSYFYFRTFDNLRFAIYVSFKYLGNSFLNLIPWIVFFILLYFEFMRPMCIFFGISLSLYFNYKISRSTYWKIINQSKQNEGEKENEIRD